MRRWLALLLISLPGAAWLSMSGAGLPTAMTIVGTSYAATARACMWLVQGLLTPHLLAWMTFISVLVLSLTAALAAAIQIYRTRRLLASLAPSDSRVLSDGVRRLVSSLDLQHRLDIVDHPDLIAFSHGLLRPRIVVSRRLVETFEHDELEAVFRHERAHLLGLDPLRVLLARSLSTAFAFVPFVSSLVEAYLARRELTADRTVVREMRDVLPLAAALQRTLGDTVPRRQQFVGLAVGALSATDARIDQLLGVSTPTRLLLRPPGRLHTAAFALLSVVTFCMLMSSIQAAMASAACIRC